MAKLTEVCANIKNYFLRSNTDITRRTFTIVSGTAPLNTLLEGQYFRIVGSVLNDGVWQNTAEDLSKLRPESFTGEIWSMSVPRDFEQLCEEISTWRDKNEANALSPFTSESFGGYSYSKGVSANGGTAVTWQSQFASRLNTYRRIHI